MHIINCNTESLDWFFSRCCRTNRAVLQCSPSKLSDWLYNLVGECMVSQIPVNRMVETSKVMSTMSDSGVQYFEGVEKLLEIWFTSDDNTNKDLRRIPRLELLLPVLVVIIIFSIFFSRDKLESLLKIVRCEIISFTRNDQIDAYVLRWGGLSIFCVSVTGVCMGLTFVLLPSFICLDVCQCWKK